MPEIIPVLFAETATKTRRPEVAQIYSIYFVPLRRCGPPISCLLLDIRTKEEFANQLKTTVYRNKGHIQGAVNIPQSELSSRLNELTGDKDKEVVVYSFGNSRESYASAKTLTDAGFKHVSVLVRIRIVF